MTRLGAFYVSFLCAALLRRMLAYAIVVYGFEVLTGSNGSGWLYVSLVGPYLVFSLLAGVLIDATSTRRVLQFTGIGALISIGLLHLIEHHAWPPTPHAHAVAIMALVFLYGVAYAIEYPAYVAAVSDVVEPAQRGRATVLVNVLAIVSLAYAPLGVGVLREFLSWSGVFAALAGCALLSVVLVNAVPLRKRTSHSPADRKPFRGLFDHCRSRPALVAVLLLATCFSALVIGPLEVLLPQFAEGPLGLRPFHAGMFIATGGTGLVVGSVAALRWIDHPRLDRLLTGTAITGAVLVVAMTLVPLPAAIPLFFASGIMGGVFSSLSIATTQALATDAVRGRVMGLFAVIFGGIPGLGGLAAGAVSETFGPVAAIRSFFGIAVLLFVVLPAVLRMAPTAGVAKPDPR